LLTVKPAPSDVIDKPGLPVAALLKDREPVVTSGTRLYPISVSRPLASFWTLVPMIVDCCACAVIGTTAGNIRITMARVAGSTEEHLERRDFTGSRI
jgi:hypothetical protein